MQRCFTNILSGDVEAAARFYESLLGMELSTRIIEPPRDMP